MNALCHFRNSLVIPLLLATGCGESGDRRFAELKSQLQSKFVVQNAPDGERTVSSIRKSLIESEDSTEALTELNVVIRGRVYAGEFPPWESGKTAFILTDATGHSGDGEHDPHSCKFCSRRINDYLVQVGFHDDGGKLFDIDSRKAFGLKEKQMLMIEGRATLDDKANILKVDATSLHFAKPRPKATSAEDPEQSVAQIGETTTQD